MQPSTMRNQLASKYRTQHFLKLTILTREYIYQAFATVFSLLVLAYFISHLLLYITGFYNQSNPSLSTIVISPISSLTHIAHTK